MNFSFARKLLGFTCIAATGVLTFASLSRAQMGGSPPNFNRQENESDEQLKLSEIYLGAGKDQDAAYKAFLKADEPAKKIQLGNSFLLKFPKSPYAEHVDVGLMNAYHDRQDWKNTYLAADNALALQPDDVDVLTTVAWTIPHVYSPNDTDAEQELDKAETYAKHAIDVLAKMPKPQGMNDAQFAASKSKRTIQAHSALGLVYFRREDYEKSAKELELATKGNSAPDPTDLFVLGADLQNLGRYGDAADAFGACGQIAGGLQSQCKQNADLAKRQADVSKSK